MRKSYNNEVILIFFQIVLRKILVFWIRIRIEMLGWIRIRIQLNIDPKHCYIPYRYILVSSNLCYGRWR